MREYETLFIVKPECQETALKKLTDRIGAVISSFNGEIIRQNDVGIRSLAYEIEKQKKGRYVCYDYAGQSGTVAEIERLLRLDENIMRFLTVTLSEEVDVEARKRQIEEAKAALHKATAAANDDASSDERDDNESSEEESRD